MAIWSRKCDATRLRISNYQILLAHQISTSLDISVRGWVTTSGIRFLETNVHNIRILLSDSIWPNHCHGYGVLHHTNWPAYCEYITSSQFLKSNVKSTCTPNSMGYWNSTSAFDFYLFIVIGMAYCIGLPNFIKFGQRLARRCDVISFFFKMTIGRRVKFSVSIVRPPTKDKCGSQLGLQSPLDL